MGDPGGGGAGHPTRHDRHARHSPARRRPQIVAQQAATLDRVSGGRLVLGLGLGHDRYGEYSAFHEQLDDARSRAKALDVGIEFLLAALEAGTVRGRRTTIRSRSEGRLPIWVAGRLGVGAGPRRAARFHLEGVAVVGAERWEGQHVSDVLERGGFSPGEVDVVLVGGDHPEPAGLVRAGATWAVPEIEPGTSGAEARTRVEAGPG